MNEIIEEIQAYLASRNIVLPPGQSPEDVDLIAEGLLDSVSMVELISFVEGKFDIFLSMEDFEAPDIGTPAGLARRVDMQRS